MRSFNVFRTLACSLVTLVAVACFDDAPIWEEFEDVRNEMSKLESRLDSLENVMAVNVSAIQSMVSVGSIQSWVYNAETGKGVITLLDGKQITIDQSVKGYSIITIEKDEDGTYYWALCNDGEIIPLIIDNKKVPVTTDVTPALKISDDNEWMISVDGGQTWVGTGISYFTGESSGDVEGGDEIVGDEGEEGEDSEEKPEAVPAVFESAKLDGDYLIVTLVGGTEIKLAVVGEAKFAVAEEQLWFSREGLEKFVSIEMENVKAFTITEKPEGWKAEIKEEYLYVTAPENFTDYPTEGTIKIFVLFENGAQPDIVSVEVAYEPMFTLARANGVVSVKLSEHTAEDFTGYVLIGWFKSDYTVEKLVAKLNAECETLTVREGSQTYKLEDIIDGFDVANEYVVAAVPYLPSAQVAQGKMQYMASDVVSIETISEESDWTVKNIRFDSAELHAVMPVTEYFGGFMTKEMWDNRGKTDMLETLSSGLAQPVSVVEYDGPANGFPDHEIYTNIEPATEYVIWYAPVEQTYTLESFVEFTFTTPDLVENGSIAAPKANVRDITSGGFTADVTPAANTYKTYAAIANSTVLAEMTNADIARYLVHTNQYSEGTAVNTVSKNSYDPSEEVYLVAVSITVDGKFGTILKQKVDLKPLVYTENLGVEVTGVEYDKEGTTTLSLSFKGSPVTMTYMAATFTYYSDDVLQSLLAKQQIGDESHTVEVSKLGGKLSIPGLHVGEEHKFYAVVTDADGNHSYIYVYEFTPTVKVDYVKSSDADYEYGKPIVSGTLKKSRDTFKYTMNVTMPAECQKYWLFCGDPEYLDNDEYIDTDAMVSMAYELLGETVHESSVEQIYEWSYDSEQVKRIYMVWLDDKDRCHTIYEINPYKK